MGFLQKKITGYLLVLIAIIFFVGGFFGFVISVHAQFNYNLTNVAVESGLKSASSNSDTLPQIIGNIIGTILSFVSVLFFLLMIYGGFMWMTARGNDEQSKKAIQVIFGAIVGVTIVLGAYAITRFIFQSFGVGGSVQPDGIPSTQEAGGSSNKAVSACTKNYPTFICAETKEKCIGYPKEVALVYATVNKGKHPSGTNYITGLCTGETTVCCDALKVKVACMTTVKSNQYACLEVEAGKCSGPTSQVQESMAKCEEAVKLINSATAGCLYEENDVWFCAPTIPVTKPEENCKGIKEAEFYKKKSDCDAKAKTQNNNGKEWCATKEGECILKSKNDCVVEPDGLGPTTFDEENKCLEYVGLKCLSKYGGTGLSCVSSPQNCKAGTGQTNIVQQAFIEKKWGVFDAGYIKNICPVKSNVCCFA